MIKFQKCLKKQRKKTIACTMIHRHKHTSAHKHVHAHIKSLQNAFVTEKHEHVRTDAHSQHTYNHKQY